MAKTYCTVSVSQTVDFDADIEIEEIIDGLSAEGRQELRKLLGPGSSPHVPDGNRLVEAAYLRARSMSECPQEFKDLLWFVHDRAIP